MKEGSGKEAGPREKRNDPERTRWRGIWMGGGEENGRGRTDWGTWEHISVYKGDMAARNDDWIDCGKGMLNC